MIFCTRCGNKLEEDQSICPICKLSIEKIDKPEQKVVISQREIIIPEKRKNIKKNVIITVILVVALVGGTFLGFGLTYPSLQQAKRNTDYWYNEYNDLYDDYNTLLSDYNDLFGEYQSILSVLEDPLIAPDLPTHDEVADWLYYDDTDELTYTWKWKCGDFAAMLMVRAKEMNWRMRIACMFYSFTADTTYGTDDPYGSHGHAFNVIEIQDYDDDGDNDWLYIEPESDQRWFINYFPDWYVHFRIYTYFTYGISETVWHSGFWVNHYSYFA